MTTTLNSFVSETQLTTSEAILTTTGSTEKRFVGMATVTNTSAANVEVTLWRIANGSTGTTGTGGNWAWRKTIPAGQALRIDAILGQVLGNSMKLSALASVDGVVNIDISGTTES